MKKNAFTLIELLAVIIILGVIIAIVVPAVINTIKDSKERAYQTNVEAIKSATESYMNMSFENYKQQLVNPGYITISINTLIDEGFLKTDIRNPKTGESFVGSVKVTKVSENKYNYEFIEG